MVATVKTFAFLGIDAIQVNVQVKISSGNSIFSIVGLGDKAITESKERIRAAINSVGLSFPYDRIIVNLSPADLLKEGSHYDLAITIGILIELGIITQDSINNYYCLGELALDGSLTKVNGILPASIQANADNYGIICPKQCGSEAAWAGNEDIIAAQNLTCIINHLKNQQLIAQPIINKTTLPPQYPDLKDIKGQEIAKRALEIAAAGGHNLLMIGTPGTGKSMLAKRLSGILPALNTKEMLEINMIHSVNGKLDGDNIITNRPFRDPHHSCSMPAMVGGGTKAKPGEISLAHNGVLFLDELAEFPRIVLDSLRQPIENGNISISRVNAHINYPANFQLIAAMNPCKCGYLGDDNKSCSRAPKCGKDYQSKISGPILDRMDIIINIAQIDIFANHNTNNNENSEEIAKRVKTAHEIQYKRYQLEPSMQNISSKTNAKTSETLINKYMKLDEETQNILKKSLEKMNISMRSYNRILKVARTIADLEEKEHISKYHVLESLSYKNNSVASV
jgi:magnesium chelatase family protein